MKLLFTLSTLLSFTILLAQPTIVESSSPVAGMQWTEYSTDEIENISLGPAGPSQTWTYTNFTEEFEGEAIDFLDPASLPAGFDGMFPDAEVAFYDDEDSTAQFFYSQADGFYLDGFGSISAFTPPPANMIDFDPDNLFIPFDFTYQDSRSDATTSETYIDGEFPLLFKSTIVTEIEGDGYGNLTTPGGNYSNVLRIRIFGYQVDSVFADTNGDKVYEFIDTDGPTDTTINYQHLQNAEPLLIASLEMNPTETEIVGFNYIVTGSVGLGEITAAEDLAIYPNPASEFIQISGSSSVEWKEYYILDITGKVVANNSLGIQEKLIDVSGLNDGVYLLQLTSESTRNTKKFYVSQ